MRESTLKTWPKSFRRAVIGWGMGLLIFAGSTALAEQPNIILMMTDDQGWGQVGFRDHPVLKTPHLDAMAANGLRLERFYAGAPVCSPTRATVLTGRHALRTGVPRHGHALRLQEKTLSEALRRAGYATGHFGKWHLNGVLGPGVPVLPDEPHGPKSFGFQTWLTASNFFDLDPLLGKESGFSSFKGDSSSVIVGEALKFIETSLSESRPFFAVIWDGSPHFPFRALPQDLEGFDGLDEKSRHHYGELVAFDRSVGVLRAGLKKMKVASNTLIWFCSDNGGLRQVNPSAMGGLRGSKNTLWEGGIRVPGIIEWPAGIQPAISSFPASTLDIFPTLVDLLELPEDSLLKPIDGISLKSLLVGQAPSKRSRPIGFLHPSLDRRAAWIDNDYKLVCQDLREGEFELYHLERDPAESKNLAKAEPERLNSMKKAFLSWRKSVEASMAGQDYPADSGFEGDPEPVEWISSPQYAPHLDEFSQRPEYRQRIANARRKAQPR
jgi:arylsulfatase A-like enzyme